MENEDKRNFDLTSFKKISQQIVGINDKDWQGKTIGRRRHYLTKTYTIEEIEKIITSGSLQAKIELSQNFFYNNGFYRRIILYYATLLKYAGLLIPNPRPGIKLSEKTNQKRYNQAISFIDEAYLPSLLTNCAVRTLVDGAYYGVIQSMDKTSLVVIDLPGAYCRSIYKSLSGNDLVEFDVRYFDTIVDQDIRDSIFSAYPKEVRNYYRKWKKGTVATPWCLLSEGVGFCFTFFDNFPLFFNIIPAAELYEEAVDNEVERDLEEIRKIIVQKIPHLTDGELLFEPEEAVEIHRGTVEMMKNNKNVSVLTTYADVDSIVSRTITDNGNNAIEKMVSNIYNEGGVSKQIFSATGNLSIETSIKNDVSLMMILAHKFSRFITYIINSQFSNNNINFKYVIYPISYYNESSFITDSFKLAQSGYSALLPALALGVTQSDLRNLKVLENDVIDIQSLLIPLQSSYTQSSSGNGPGAPAKPDEEKSTKTIQNQVSLDNQGGSD